MKKIGNTTTPKVPANVTLASFIKSNYVRREKMTAKYGFTFTYELEEFLERRAKRAKKTA